MKVPVVAVVVVVVVVGVLLILGASASVARAQTKPSAPPASLQLGPPTPAELFGRDGARDAATTTPTQDAGDPGNRAQVEAGLYEFLSTRFHAHEPMYFLYGPSDPNTKFQISLKYQLFSDTGPIARAAPSVADLFVAYSQTSFWDIDGQSSPFVDTSYRPELMYQLDPKRAAWLPGMTRFDLQAGLKHESNGQSGADSRSLNTAYISPIFTFGDDGMGANDGGPDEFFVAVAPRVWMYLTAMPDNPDIYHYRGYGDVRLVAGWRGGFQTAVSGGFGNDWDKGWLQVDFSYPLQRFAIRDLGMYLYAQFFTGYGESLLDYNESSTTFRMGLSLVR